MRKLFKKVMSILLMMVFLFPIFQNSVFATKIGETKLIKFDKQCEHNLQFWNESKNRWSYITCSYVYYEDNGKEYPAYCLNKGLPGVGDTDSNLSVDPYDVDITKLMDDVRIWRTAINGYPYKTPEELGVHDKYDAFLATKQSIYCILYGTDPETYFKAPNDRAKAIKDAIIKMVDIGRNGTQTPSNIEVTIKKIGKFIEDGDYYSQEYEVNSPVESGEYTITSTSGLPQGSKITTTSNKEKTTFNANEHFKLRIPKNKLTQNLNAIIAVQAKCKTYPVFYGETTVPGTQDYLITYDPYGDTSGIVTLKVTVEGKLNFEKISSDNNIWTGHIIGSGVSGAEYTIKDNSGKIVKKLTTNSEGKAQVSLSPGKYTIYESKSPNNFILDPNIYEFEISHHGSTTNLTVKENVEEGGYFSAKKTASLNNIWTGHKVNDPVSGATYGIFTMEGKLVEVNGELAKKTSDENGVIFNKYKLKLGNYYMQEVEPAPYFQKDNTKYYFTVSNNEQQINLNVKNRSDEGGYVNLKKISKGNNLWTGHIDGEPVAGATYRIESLDKDWHIDVTTNLDGKIEEPDFTSNDIELSLGNYKCYEISGVDGFKISSEEKYFTLDKNEEKIELTLEEEPEEAGKVIVSKKASDYNYKNNVKKGEPVVGAIYKIYHTEDDKEIATLTVSDNGISNEIILGKGNYYIKETWVGEDWILNETPIYFTIDKNEDNKYFDFTNEPVTTGFLNINKTVLEDNTLNGDPEGMPLSGVKFELRDENDNVLLELVTDENGQFSEDIMLDKGKYYLWEVECPDYYILNEEPDVFEITENGQKVIIDIKNKPAEAKIDVKKTGIIQAQAGDEIRYNFNVVANNSNVSVDNFTLTDNLPYEYIEMKKLFTGVYSHELNFNVLYKTNFTEDFIILKENLNTKCNNFIDFENIELKDGEFITDFKLEFGTVPKGFKAEITPFMFAKVKSTVDGNDKWTNKVSLTANYLDIELEDKDEWTTISYEKKLEIKKLPRTGM